MKTSASSAFSAAVLASLLLGPASPGIATALPAPTPPVAQASQDANAEQLTYHVRYVDLTGKDILRTTHTGKPGASLTVTAEDLFAKGYERFDSPTKPLTLTTDHQEVVFTVGKARELMSLTEFLRQPVQYDYPLHYRNLDFTSRQDDLEDFVIKHIYQGDKDTGVFYGTKEQGDKIRETLLNGSFQGAYTRYVTDFRPSIPKHVSGDTYEMSIEFVYQEYVEEIKKGEAQVDAFIAKYGTDYTDAEKAKLIHDWLMKNGTLFEPPHQRQEWFHNSKGVRRVHFPASLLVDGEGVCLTYAMTYGRLAERMGLETRLIQGYTGLSGASRAAQAQRMFDNPDTTTYRPTFLNHTWNLVKIDRTWHHVDTFQDKVLLRYTEHDPNPHRYFLQSDEFIREHKVQMGDGKRIRNYTVNRAWNTHRIPTAHAAMNEFRVMRDRSEKDLQS